MGWNNMFQVMDALEGVEVSLKGWEYKKRAIVDGSNKIRKLDAYDFALLMAIARRQPDEQDPALGPDPNASEYICYGGEGLLSDMAHMSTDKLEECRAFLVKTNLISYKRVEKCPEYLREKVEKDDIIYSWRLNKPAIFGLRRNAKKKKTPSRGDVDPAKQGTTPRTAGTKNTYKTTFNRSMSPAAAAEEKADRRNRALVWIDYIALKYDLTPKQKDDVGVKGIIVGIAKKRAEDVRKVIDNFGQTDMLDRKFGVWVGMLVGDLKELPNADDLRDCLSLEDLKAYLSPEKLEGQFGAPMAVDEPTRRKKAAQKLWNEIYNGLGFEDLPDKGKGCMQALIKCLEAHKADFDATIARIRANTPGLDGFNLLGAQEKSDAHARAEKLKGILAELTP